jgi:1,2-diacylglycerol 3-beta-glucosyltransferase
MANHAQAEFAGARRTKRLMSRNIDSLSRLADVVVGAATVPGAIAGVYLAVLSVPAKLTSPPHKSTLRLAVVVPAHNEAADIEATVTSLLNTDYPTSNRRVVVVADNCTDNTAALARDAGAEVFERHNLELRGKGYALEHAFEKLTDEGLTDAVVIVDADTIVSKNLLTACASRLAAGELVVQADYQVRNSETSWRTRLLHIAFTGFHEVRSTGRERFGLSCGLRGNGMAFSMEALRRVPHSAFSIVEDLEYGIALGKDGIRVAYAHEAWVRGHMPSEAKTSETQRSRWEGGRRLIRATHGRSLVAGSIKRKDKLLADLAADVYVPPLGQLGTAMIATSALALAGSAIASEVTGRSWKSPLVAGVGVLGLIVHVEEAWRRSGTGANGLFDLVRAPIYVAWKFGRRIAERGTGSVPGEWVRTERSDMERDSKRSKGSKG